MISSRSDPTIEVYIISWTGQHSKAAHVETELARSGVSATVVWSDKNEALQAPSPSWIRVPNSYFFAAKFNHIIRRFRGDVLLMITADGLADNWGAVAGRCRDVFRQYPNLGVWSPLTNYSSWQPKAFSLGNIRGTRLHLMFQTDSIVWAMSAEVVQRMREADYDANTLGWGIDTMACMFCHANDHMVVLDPEIRITHPIGTEYSTVLADQQLREFLKQLSSKEQSTLDALKKRTSLKSAKNSDHARGLSRNAPCPCGSGKKFKQCCLQTATR